MFRRIYAVLMAAILAVAFVVTGICWSALKNSRINDRLQELTRVGRQIAWVAGQSDSSDLILPFRTADSASTKYLRRLASDTYEQYGAYILVVDRSGRVMDNLQTLSQNDPDFVSSLSSKAVSDALTQILNGQEIALRTEIRGDAKFTVGTPFIRRNVVLGAVLIQTPARSIEDGLSQLLIKVLCISAAAILLSGIAAFLLVRGIAKPVRQLQNAALRWAEGDFAVRCTDNQRIPEVRDLSRSFNTMADRLSKTESSRREFVANVSHELRSPITGIHGFVQGMTDGTIPPEEHNKYLHIVLDETNRLTKLIGDLLALSRLQRDDVKPDLKDFDICEMMRRAVIRRMSDIDGKHLEIRCEFPQEALMVTADEDRIDQVAVNLMDNAIKFTPDGGCITLRCREADGKVAVTVADNGQGVPSQDRDRVFDRFFTSDRAHTSGKGTGLGLSICQRILQMHGCTIALDDTAEGASFTFTLPKSQNAINGGE